MRVLIQQASYDSYGASGLYSIIGDLLTVEIGEYGSAAREIEIIAYLRSAVRRPRPTLERTFDQFHASLDKLPKATFRRKLKRIDFKFVSERFTAEDDGGWKPVIERCRLAAEEIAHQLPIVVRSVKSADDFDVDRFLHDAATILRRDIPTVEEWEAIRLRAKEIRRAAFEAMDPWERLEIDWSEYHPNARRILDDPWYWSLSDDLAPHGNDTGADLLADFQKWNRRHPQGDPVAFLKKLFEGWGISLIDWKEADEIRINGLIDADAVAFRVSNEASIALAFAVLKCRGACPPHVLQMALAAIQREVIALNITELNAEKLAVWRDSLAKMQRKLTAISETSE